MVKKDEAAREREQILELLVPEGGELKRRASRAADLARALGGGAAEDDGVAADARIAFEREGRTRAGGALEDLLVHHLRAVFRGRSFLFLPEPRVAVQAAWEVLAALRVSYAHLPGVPGPGEGALAVAARLLDGLYRLDWEDELLELWRARLDRAERGEEAGVRSFRERLAGTPATGSGSRTYSELILGLAECLLDRGAVNEARELLEPELRAPSRFTRGRWQRLRCWTAVLSGAEVPDVLQVAKETWEMELPRALVELREDWSAGLPALSGRAPTAGVIDCLAAPSVRRTEQVFTRSSVGAAVFGVFVLGEGGAVSALHLEVAPGLRNRVDHWRAEREGACCVRTTSEHEMVVRADAVRAHGTRLASALGDRSLALALVPVLDEEGEVAGWLHFEWEHHLIPDEERLAELARRWESVVWREARPQIPACRPIVDRVSERGDAAWSSANAKGRLTHALADSPRALCAPLFERCVLALGIKLGQRRWWAFVHERGETKYVTGGGQGLGDALIHPGGARGLDRCLASAGVVRFDEADPRLALHAGSFSGLVLPLLDRGRVVGMLVLESSRRRDFKTKDIERFVQTLESFALPLVLCGFRSWHLERFGHDLYFDCTRASMRELAQHMNVAARANAAVVLCGPGGAGKRMLARWLHWSRGREGEELTLLHAELDFPQGASRSDFRARLGRLHGSLILDALPCLAPELQEELLRFLEGERPAATGGPEQARLIVTTTEPLEQSVERGKLRPELAARLERMQVFVPGLMDRREDLPGLVSFLASRFAGEEGCRTPSFTDAAFGLLWRQSWKGNLRDLEGLVFKLVLLYPGRELDVDEVRSAARRFRFPLLEKLASRRPRRRDLVQALRTTLKHTGSLNKRRAALYLGWDPDTLAARLAEQELDAETLAGEP